MAELQHWENDTTIYLFTSLTAGSSHIITATSRIETILKANRIPFTYIDTATNDDARKLWVRRSSGKKLPAVVKEGFILGDLAQIEEWNEFGELKENIGDVAPPGPTSITTTPAKPTAPATDSTTAASGSTAKQENVTPSQPKSPTSAQTSKQSDPISLALRQAGMEAASIAADKKKLDSASASAASPPTSGIVSAKSPTSASPPPASAQIPEEAVSSSTSLPESVGMNQFRTHRGSSVSLANDEEIKKVEQETAIPEAEEEDEESEHESEGGKEVDGGGVVDSAAKSTKEDLRPVEDGAVKEEEKPRAAEALPAEAEEPSTTVKPVNDAPPKPQEQSATDSAKAGETVED